MRIETEENTVTTVYLEREDTKFGVNIISTGKGKIVIIPPEGIILTLEDS